MSGALAFAFPGAGVRPSGHEGPFFQQHRAVMAPLLERASAACGVDCLAPLLERAPWPVGDGAAQQLFSCALGCALGAAAEARFGPPGRVAGFSLGLYPALVSAGALSLEAALQLTAEAHRLAREHGGGDGAMVAVVGLSGAELEALLAATGEPTLALSNRLSPHSAVVSGRAPAVMALAEAALRDGALKVEPLAVDLPYHNPRLLAGAAPELARVVGDLPWAEPCCPLHSSFDGRPLRSAAELRRLTAQNLLRPLRWQAVVEALGRAGVRRVLECGPGGSLAAAARLVPGAPRFITLKSLVRGVAP